MGFFSILKGLFGRGVSDAEIERQIEALMDDDSGPSQHYVFAHLALRQFLHDEPLKFFGILASDISHEFLQDVWNDIGEQVTEEGGEKVEFTFSMDQITTARCGSYPIAVVKMPEPQSVAEAHLIAAVLMHESQPEEGKPIEACYYTLEKGMTFGEDEPERTVWCEWTKDGQHSNFGDGPEPEPKAFIEWIGKQNKWTS